MELIVGNRYEVKVTRIVKSGAIVELEDGTTEFIHVSNISDDYVRDASDYVEVGDVLVALAQDGLVTPVELSLKNLKLQNRRDVQDVQGMYGGLANPSLGFESSKNDSRSRINNGSAAKAIQLDKMIKKSNEDLKSKTYFNDKRSKGKKKRGRR